MFGSVTSKLYQVAIQRKVAGVTNSISESVSDAVADDPQDGEGKKRKALSRDQRAHYEVVAKEAGNMFSVAMKARMWVTSSNADGLVVEYLQQRAFPVSHYRCTGRVRVAHGITGQQLAASFVDLMERRRWDPELQPGSRVLHEVNKTTNVVFTAHGSVLGGVVSGRDYVDVCATDTKVSATDEKKNLARAFWVSIKWEDVLDPNCVRGWNYPQGITFEELEPGVFEMRLSVHRDVKVRAGMGWLPYAAAESATPGSLQAEWKAFRDFVQAKWPAE